jgi:hypothetical protein
VGGQQALAVFGEHVDDGRAGGAGAQTGSVGALVSPLEPAVAQHRVHVDELS